jgi:hypothetical protein
MPRHRRTSSQPVTLGTALVLALTTTLFSSATATAVPTTGPRIAAEQDVSPSGCVIMFVDNPHYSDSVKGAVKVNARAECNRAVPENNLSVTLFGDNMTVLRETVVKSTNKSYVVNQSTYITCKNHTDMHTFHGAAMGTSFEDGRPFVQFKFGNMVPLACGY